MQRGGPQIALPERGQGTGPARRPICTSLQRQPTSAITASWRSHTGESPCQGSGYPTIYPVQEMPCPLGGTWVAGSLWGKERSKEKEKDRKKMFLQHILSWGNERFRVPGEVFLARWRHSLSTVWHQSPRGQLTNILIIPLAS